MAETLKHLASPAKRRKMFLDDEEGFLCSPSPAAGQSRLRSSSYGTPKLIERQAASEPRTSSSQSQAGMVDGQLAVSPQQLPPQLVLLNQLLGALYVTIPLVKSRGKPTTFQNLQVPVQNFCGRDFKIQHVQQIKALCPEALGWEYILAMNQATKKQEQQLLLTMPNTCTNGKGVRETAELQLMLFEQLQQHQQVSQSSKSDKPLPMAELPTPAGPSARDCTPNRRPFHSELLPGTPQTAPPAGGALSRLSSGKSSNSHLMMSPPAKRAAATCARGNPNYGSEGLMSPPPARTCASFTRQAAKEDQSSRGLTFSPVTRHLPLIISPAAGSQNSSMSHHTPVKDAADNSSSLAPALQTPGLRPNKLFATPVLTATPEQLSILHHLDTTNTPMADERQPATSSVCGRPEGPVKVRKLTFDAVHPKKPANDMVTPDAAGSKQSRPGSIKFELGESAMALLNQVSSVEGQREKTACQQQLDQQRALDMLPGTFDVMRSVFGDKGPCVKSMSEVLQLIRQKSTCRSGMSPADAAEQLDLFLRFVPEFVRIVHTSGQSLAGMSQSVRINRQIPWPTTRQKLLAAAANARSTGLAAAAAALAADKIHDQQVLAAAAVDNAQSSKEVSEVDIEASEGEEASEDADAGLQDDVGLDILAELSPVITAGKTAIDCTGPVLGSDGLTDEARILLGGGAAVGSVPAHGMGFKDVSLFGCLAFKPQQAVARP